MTTNNNNNNNNNSNILKDWKLQQLKAALLQYQFQQYEKMQKNSSKRYLKTINCCHIEIVICTHPHSDSRVFTHNRASENLVILSFWYPRWIVTDKWLTLLSCNHYSRYCLWIGFILSILTICISHHFASLVQDFASMSKFIGHLFINHLLKKKKRILICPFVYVLHFPK